MRGTRLPDNKPPYQERQISFDVSGPSIPGRLSSTFELRADRCRERRHDPRDAARRRLRARASPGRRLNRGFEIENTYQLAPIAFDRDFDRPRHRNEPGRRHRRLHAARTAFGRVLPASGTPTSTPSRRCHREASTKRGSVTTRAAARRCPSAKRSGSTSSTRSTAAARRTDRRRRNRTIEFGNLFTRLGERLTIKTGIEGALPDASARCPRTTSAAPSPSRAWTPTSRARRSTYRVTRGNPLFEHGQLEMAGFFQGDVQLNPRLMMMFGVRYEAQQYLDDYDNLDPRVAVAYSPGPDTVIRAAAASSTAGSRAAWSRTSAGSTAHSSSRSSSTTRSYPDPFAGGTIRQSLPSVRVTDPNLVAPYVAVDDGLAGADVFLQPAVHGDVGSTCSASTTGCARETSTRRTTPASSRARRVRRRRRLTRASSRTPHGATSSASSRRATKSGTTLRLSVRKRFSIFRGVAELHRAARPRRRAGRPRHAADECL